MNPSVLLRVTAIRSQNPRGFGGCIFSAKTLDQFGQVADAAAYVVVRASSSVLGGAEVQPGQWWRVAGALTTCSRTVNGFQLREIQLEAETAVFERPSGEHLVRFMADNPAFEGIGEVKARRLWDAFGERLYGILADGDLVALTSVLGRDVALTAVAAWAEQGDAGTLQWLQSEGFDVKLAKKVLRFFGKETEARLKEDPYRLLSFCGSWREVDRLAKKHFDVQPDDPRRIKGAIEEACNRVFSDGHTSVLTSGLMSRLAAILGPQTESFRWRGLVTLALNEGLTNGSYVVGHHGVQPLGALVMERQVAASVAERIRQDSQPLLPASQVDILLDDYELAEGIELNAEQRLAVQTAACQCMAVITGGAGVGKTTVLKALYAVYDAAGVDVVQLALAGRAAKRMQEATGRPASTIANFLRHSGELSANCVVVVDEASMVDIITMSRLVVRLGTEPRLLLVGDPAQLMPVGPGLVLHALVQVPQVPNVELKVVKRYGGSIAEAALAFRAGRWPALPVMGTGAVGFIPCEDESIAATVLALYREEPGNTQVLCARRNGPDGSRRINALCQSELTAGAVPVRCWSEQHESFALTGLHLGDPVICNRNLWERGLQNGSLGVIVEVAATLRPGEETSESDEPVLAWALWDDGEKRPIVESMLDDLELGYAITVHKAQGSQWPRVIVPVTGNRLLDRTMLYTALTRAQRQVLLVGDARAAQHAVEGLPRAALRSVLLDVTTQRLAAA